MSTNAFRIRVVRAVGWTLVACLFAWPFVHRWLCVHQLVNPWKLGGFAMYTVFDPPDHANVWATDDHLQPAIFLTAYEQEALEGWLYWSQYLGLLYPPEELGELLLAPRPDAPLIMTIHRRIETNPETGMTFWRVITYHTVRVPQGYETRLIAVEPPPGSWDATLPP